jgi:hypothetical protein
MWSDFFPGDGGLDALVNAMVVHDSELFLGGVFANCAGRVANYVARWNGHRWAGVGKGLYIDEYLANYAHALVEDPSTMTLYAGAEYGVYREPNDLDDPNEPWPIMAATNAPVRALVVYQGALYAGGDFTEIAGQALNYIARWDGTAWEEVGGGVGPDPNDANSPPAKVLALTVFDDGLGEPALFVGGTFTYAGPYPDGVPAKRIARWKNGTWSAVGAGVQEPANAEVDALAGWPGGRLFVGGTMTLVGDSVAVRGIAGAQPDANDNWTWSALGAGVLRADGGPGAVHSLAVLDPAGGAALHASGMFRCLALDPNDPNDLTPALRIAKWDGTGWSALASDPNQPGFSGPVSAQATYYDGFGSPGSVFWDRMGRASLTDAQRSGTL